MNSQHVKETEQAERVQALEAKWQAKDAEADQLTGALETALAENRTLRAKNTTIQHDITTLQAASALGSESELALARETEHREGLEALMRELRDENQVHCTLQDQLKNRLTRVQLEVSPSSI